MFDEPALSKLQSGDTIGIGHICFDLQITSALILSEKEIDQS